MDPNANIQEQERLLAVERDSHGRSAARLRELRAALAEWIRGGGFAPDWTQAPRAAAWYGRGIDYVVSMVGPISENGSAWIPYRQISVFGDLQFEDRPLPWQLQGLQETASGYGQRLTSRRVAILPDGRARRVYVTCFSNSGTAWIRLAGRIVIVE